MPKQTTYAITWSPTTLRYHLCDPHHAKTLAALYGNHLILDSNSQEWFDWLAPIASFAFVSQTGRFTARRETKQRGENYWSAYQRSGGKLLKKYMGKTTDLSIEKLEEIAKVLTLTTSPCITKTSFWVQDPPIALSVWTSIISEQIRAIDIGQDPQGPPYNDAPWLLDRSSYSLVTLTPKRCPTHPTARFLRNDPSGQAWCNSRTCWWRCNLLHFGKLLQFHMLLGYDWDTRVQAGEASWSTYVHTKDDEHIAFSTRQALQFCEGLGLQPPDLSEQARLRIHLFDAYTPEQ